MSHAPTGSSPRNPRFSLGVGTGESLNEHILGDRWPGVVERQDRLEEAIEVIRGLWGGKLTSHRGEHFTVENARLYSLPEEPPPLLVAVAGESSVELAARFGDGASSAAPTPSATGRRFGSTPTPATTTSTSIRLAPIKTASSTFTSARCFPLSPNAAPMLFLCSSASQLPRRFASISLPCSAPLRLVS